MRPKTIAPSRVGTVEVLRELPPRGNRRTVLCKCACGREWSVLLQAVLAKTPIRSCKQCADAVQKSRQVYADVKGLSGSRWYRIVHNARTRGIDFELTAADAVALFEQQQRRCALTGWPITLPEKPPGTRGTGSLDRIDSLKGYVPTNVQWVHKDINRMKQNLSEDRFVELCAAVIRHRSPYGHSIEVQ